MKAYGTVEVQFHHSLSRHYMELNGQLDAPAPLSQNKEPANPLDRMQSGPQCRSGRFGEEKTLLPMLGI
jgi:hypothetical protein